MPAGGLWALTFGRRGCPRGGAKSLLRRTSALSLEGPLERLIESCSDFFVIGGRDLALLFFDLQLKQFFFQRFEQHRRFGDNRSARLRRRGCSRHWTHRSSGARIAGGRGSFRDRCRPGCGYGLPFRDHPSPDGEEDGECPDDWPAVFLQGIRRIDGNAQSAAWPIVTCDWDCSGGCC